MEFLKIGFIELIDITLVAVLIYQFYKLVKGTVAINIFIGLSLIYLLWKLVSAFHFQLLSEILGQFIGLGVIILAIVFQQELRKFLILIGKGKIIKNNKLFKVTFSKELEIKLNTSIVSKACENMSTTKTGDLGVFSESGVEINAQISEPIIDSIFYKNSPLHDGAMIIRNNKIISARCVLPISNNNLPKNLGMRHRAAVGITEESDVVAIIVSEETGHISYGKEGELFIERSAEQLKQFLDRIFMINK